ncbi:unnamed protein product, partial [Polarella glacialis]
EITSFDGSPSNQSNLLRSLPVSKAVVQVIPNTPSSSKLLLPILSRSASMEAEVAEMQEENGWSSSDGDGDGDGSEEVFRKQRSHSHVDASNSSTHDAPTPRLRQRAQTLGSLPESAAKTKWRTVQDQVLHPERGPRGGLGARRGLVLKLQEASSEPVMQTPSSQPSSLGPDAEAQYVTSPVNSELRRRRSLVLLGSAATSLENKQPAVQLLFRTQDGRRDEEQSRKDKFKAIIRSGSGTAVEQFKLMRLPRPLPGAFPSRRTVFFFDWDDTLCPTSWIRSLLKKHLADAEEWVNSAEPEAGNHSEDDWRDKVPSWFSQPLPDEPAVHKLITALQHAVINAINVAQAFGVVCIVTNAVPGWVEKTIKRWLPQLKQYICGHVSRPPIKVIYAQQSFVANLDSGLSHVDEQGEYMLWKKAAMAETLDDMESLYRLSEYEEGSVSRCLGSGAVRIANVISIGDSEAEMIGAELASRDFDTRRTAPKRGRQYIRSDFLAPSAAHEREGTCDSNASGSDADWGSGSESLGTPSSKISAALAAMGMANESTVLSPSKDPQYGGGRRHSVDGTRSPHWPWVKLVKFRECSHVKRLTVQLEELAELLPQMVALRQHVRVDISVGTSSTVARSAEELQEGLLRCSNDDLLVERYLQTQTV